MNNIESSTFCMGIFSCYQGFPNLMRYQDYRSDFEETMMDKFICEDYPKKLLKIPAEHTYFYKNGKDDMLLARFAGRHYIVYLQYKNCYRMRLYLQEDIIADVENKIKGERCKGPGISFLDTHKKYNKMLYIDTCLCDIEKYFDDLIQKNTLVHVDILNLTINKIRSLCCIR